MRLLHPGQAGRGAIPGVGRSVLAIVVACALGLACASDPPPPHRLQFFDSRLFDDSLHESLVHGHPAVSVVFQGTDATLNQVPPRVDKWIYSVKQKGGQVVVRDDPAYPQPKSPIAAALGLAVAVYPMITQWVMYRPAGDYDVHVYHVPGDARLTRLVFMKKAEEGR